ncbi:flagellar filament capping protein FliD [Microbacteriaceae bacterium K1510]|nr:flagellar filament capping protein FliD [Microbacteriaceae bacterium K1510]
MSTVSSTTSTSTTSASSYTSSTSSTSANSSTVDWNGLIEAMVQAKLAKADTIDTQITTNQTKISTYQSLQTLLQDLTTKANALSNPAGVSSASTNVFANRAGYLTANGDVTASSVASVDVASGTDEGTYDLVVEQIAKAQKVASSAIASNSSALGYSGVFSIGTSDGTSADISITSSMTLADVVEAINNQTSTTGVRATSLQVSDGEYELLLTTTGTGQTITTSSVSGDDVLNQLGVTDSTGAFTNEIQAAAQAKIKLDGVEITRDSNDISDVLDGVTFHLYSTTPTGTSVSVQVAPNLTNIETAINNFVTSYNALRDFVIAQNKTASDGTADSSAVLFGDSTLRSVSQQLESDLNTMVSNNSLASFGITFDTNNKLEVDTTTLESALNNNLSGIQSLFEFQSTSSASDIRILARGSNAPTSFTLDVSVDGSGAVTSASVGGDSSLFTISGTRIIGKSGTAFDGFSFSFAGSASESIDFTLSYGLAQKINADSDAVGNATSGTLTSLIDNIEQQDTDLTSRSTTIKSQAETYRTQLTARYAQIQQQILSANSTITYLKQLSNTKSSS